jgi:DNA-binding NarL/FixJ family response regulator
MTEDLRVAGRSTHPVVVAGLGATLRSAPGLSFVAAANAQELGHLLKTSQLDVVIWHVDRTAGDAALASLRRRKNLAIVAATEDSDVDGAGIIRLLRQGVISVVSIASDLAALPRVCRDAASGRPYLSPSLVAMIVTHYHGGGFHAAAATSFGLTSRELEVLEQLVAGASHEEIAGRLTIEVRTVRYHLEQVYRKLNVSGRHQAVALAYQHGLAA